MYQITKNLSDRMNVLKFLAIVMVVFIHISPAITAYDGAPAASISEQSLKIFIYAVSQSISRTAVPLFFLISSILLYSKNFLWLENMKKKCRSVLLPYVFWNTFWILFSFITQTIPEIAKYFPRDSYYIRGYGIAEWLKAYTYLNGNYPYLYTLWFLRDLFIMNILAVVIKLAVDKAPRIILFVVMIIWLGTVPIPYLDNQTLVFFVLGYYAVKYQIYEEQIDRINWLAAASAYAVFLVFDYRLSYHYPFFHQITVIFGVIVFIKLSKELIQGRIGDIILRLSKYSFIIYVFHEMNLSIVRTICSIVFPQTILIQLAEYLLIPPIIILECVVFGIVFKKISPRLYQLAIGNRSNEARSRPAEEREKAAEKIIK